MSRFKIQVLLSIVVVLASSWDAQAAGAREPTWIRYFGQDGFNHILESAAFDESTMSLIVATTTSLADEVKPDYEPVLWRIDGDGQQTGEIPLPEKLQDAGLENVAVHLDGHIHLGLNRDSGDAVLARLTPAGELSALHTFGNFVEGFHFSKLLALPNGSVVIAGAGDSGATLLILGKDGKTLLNRTLEDISSRYVDVLPVFGGGFITVANAGEYEMFFLGPSKVRIEHLDNKGKVLAELTLDGRYGALAPTRDGHVLLYDRSATIRQDWRLAHLGAGLRQGWRAAVKDFERSVDDFEIASRPGGRFVAVGTDFDHVWVGGLDARGGEMWSFSGEGLSLVPEHTWVPAGNGFFVVSVGYVEKGDRLEEKIQDIRFDGVKPSGLMARAD